MPELERITFRIDADISDYKRSLAEAEKAATRTAERVTATFRDVHRNASQATRGPQAFGVALRRVGTASGDKRNFSSLRLPTGQSRSINQAAGTLADGSGVDATRRLANLPKQAAAASSFLKTGFSAFGRIFGLISEIVAVLAFGAEILSKKSQGFDAQLEKQNRLVREQARKLLDVKGLIDSVAEEVENTETLLSQERARLESLQPRRKGARRRLEEVERGGGDQTSNPKTRLDLAVRALNRIAAEISQRELNISLLEKALAAQAAANDSAGPGLSPELERCLLLLCDRLKSFGQDIPFDRAAASPGNGGQFLPASFSGASPLGGGGRDGLDRGLADTGGRVEDLSAGFLELTQAAGGFEDQGGSLVELLTRSNALFGEQSGLLGQLSAQAPVLGGELAALFEDGAEAGRAFSEVADAVGSSLLDAFEGAIARGESLGDVLKGLAIDMAEILLKSAGNALLGSILGGLGGGIGGFAKGGAFARDETMARNLKAFARGGIVDTPEAFAFANAPTRSQERSAVLVDGVHYGRLEHESFVYRESCPVHLNVATLRAAA